ncbi:APC family permease [Brevibacillus fluminis]|uniref:APC family permease n=1 Tax=Brevibacillus fluminis TaxID=511487 RepID=A0A3M8DAD7_9BACL|nr:APC family permease [Brevibacillus fluminis]RNB85032.1 APC family permease [Brevibacillus fluminis]
MDNQTGLQRKLKLWHVFALGLSLMVPTTVFDTYGIASGATGGHVPISYLFSMCAILFTVFSYTHMVKVFPRAGSAYTYAQQTFNPGVGFVVGWAALCDYLFLPMLYALAAEIYLSSFFPDVPGWLWIVLSIAFFTIANIFSVKVTISFNAIFVVFQMIICVVFVALLIRELAGSSTSFSLAPFYSANLTMNSILSGSIILCYTLIGFDALSTLSEEAIEPTKTIPRAMIIQTIFLGLLYTTITYFMQLLFPDVSVFNEPDAASSEIAQKLGGMLFASIFIAITVTGNLVGGIAAQLSTSRLLFAMGRDNVIPKRIFGYVNPRTGVPVWNVLLTGIFSLTAVFLSYETAISFFSFGAYIAFSFVNLSVIVYFYRQRKMNTFKGILMYLVGPLIALCFLVLLWANMDMHALLLGLVWNVVGIGYLAYLTKFFSQKPPQFHFDENVSG